MKKGLLLFLLMFMMAGTQLAYSQAILVFTRPKIPIPGQDPGHAAFGVLEPISSTQARVTFYDPGPGENKGGNITVKSTVISIDPATKRPYESGLEYIARLYLIAYYSPLRSIDLPEMFLIEATQGEVNAVKAHATDLQNRMANGTLSYNLFFANCAQFSMEAARKGQVISNPTLFMIPVVLPSDLYDNMRAAIQEYSLRWNLSGQPSNYPRTPVYHLRFDPYANLTFVNTFNTYTYSIRWPLSGARLAAGVEDVVNMAAGAISAYPNPFADKVKVHAQDAAKVQLTDMRGQVVKSLNVSGTMLEVNTADVPSGMYLLQVLAADGTVMHTQKLVK